MGGDGKSRTLTTDWRMIVRISGTRNTNVLTKVRVTGSCLDVARAAGGYGQHQTAALRRCFSTISLNEFVKYFIFLVVAIRSSNGGPETYPNVLSNTCPIQILKI